jgi:UPF0176 protein
MDIVNIAAYKFVRIPDPAGWREVFVKRTAELGLKGTILLAEEGINLFLAGARPAIDEFLRFLRQEAFFGGRFSDLTVKESLSASQPFGKMRVRLKKEIITMKHPTIRPEGQRAPAVDPATLKEWLDRGHDDDGRPVVLLDTRNAFEIAVGTFKGAVALDIEHFSHFPDAIRNAIADKTTNLQNSTIVPFCTGGIRCEKAAIFMQELNLPNVYQLEGGILGYFQAVGGEHWQGHCFVFDGRVALDPQLQPLGITRAELESKGVSSNTCDM